MNQAIEQRFQKQQVTQALSFLFCGVLISALGLSSLGPGPLVAATLCVLWSITGLLLRIPGALAVLLLTAIHLPAGIGVGVACIIIALVAVFLDMLFAPDTSSSSGKLRPLRNELRDAEFQQETLQRHIGRYPVLLDSCTTFARAQELGQLATMLCEQSRKIVTQYNSISVFFGRGDDIYCAYAIDEHKNSISMAVSDNERFCLKESRLLVLRDATMNHVYVPLRGERRQEMSRLESGVNGALYVCFKSGGIDDELLIDILRALGRLGGLTLAAVNLMEQARALALHDDLTGLYGRHEYERRLNEQISLCRRNKNVLGLIMCDMDYLKKFNDTFGHQAGDEALKAIAQNIKESLPGDGVACRFGGEEFSAFVVAESTATVAALAEKIRASISETQIGVDAKLTASIGWSILLTDDAAEHIIKRADDACYQAKANGRNQVVEGDHGSL